MMNYKSLPKGIVAALVVLICFHRIGCAQAVSGSSIAGREYHLVKLDDGSDFEVVDGFEVVRPTTKAENNDDDTSLPTSFSSGQAVRLQDGRLLLIFPNLKKLEATFSSDGGRSWTRPLVIAGHSGRPAVVQAKNGTIWAIYYNWVSYDGTKKGSRSDLYTISSVDGGKTWSNQRKIWEGYTGMTQGMIETRDGTLVMPFSYVEEPTRYLGACVYSRDGGKCWQSTEGIDVGKELDAAQRKKTGLNGGTLEPTIVQLEDGRLMMVIRTVVGTLWHCYSQNDGATWSNPEPMSLTCGGPVYITRLISGRLAMVWNEADRNNADAKRWGFPYGYARASIALSDNEGEAWSEPVVFARNGRSVHSMVVDLGQGELLFTMPGKPMFLRCKEQRLL